MKKVLMIALAGVMMFAFTQCGGGKDGGGISASSSKEYKETKELYDNLQKIVKDAKDCEQLQEAALSLVFGALAGSFGDYADNEKMTEKEKAEIDKLVEKIGKEIEDKSAKLGCDEDE
jgi:hypothetical protein